MSKYYDGIKVHPRPYKGGEIYAEIVPAGQPWYRRLLPHVGNWWFEISSQEGHHIELDGGAYTLSGAIRKAMNMIENEVEESYE